MLFQPVNSSGCKGATHVARVPERGWPLPLTIQRSHSGHSEEIDGPIRLGRRLTHPAKPSRIGPSSFIQRDSGDRRTISALE